MGVAWPAVAKAVAIEGRWYAPLVRPVLPALAPAMDQMCRAEVGLSDPWSVPRAGLGGAMVVHVSRGFGRRAGRRAERVAVAAVEVYNHRLHVGERSAHARARWLARDLEWTERAWRALLEHEGPALTRVLDRLFGPEGRGGDFAIPEAVLFLRGAIAAGVVLGDVGARVHAQLDRHVTWLGLSWEAQRGTLDPVGWEGALAAVGLDEALPDAPEPLARTRASEALDALPECAAVELLRGVLAQAPREREMERIPRTWVPMRVSMPEQPARSLGSAGSAPVLSALSQRWGPPLERALAELTDTRCETFAEASSYLQAQGGKRARPLLTLSAAEACGGADEAQRALGLAAGVEWLHQGSLLLDDIVDAAELRRGRQALHAATSPTFAAGVATFVFARVVRASQGMHPDIRSALVNSAATLAEGERLELQRTGEAELSRTDYYAIIAAKTASLFACAVEVGARAVGAPRGQVRALVRYGRELGLAFQIIDDVLDYVGEARVFGKRPGTDLAAGKATLPFIVLREALGGAERERLLRALGRSEDFQWVLGQMAVREVAARCRAQAEQHTERAVAALDRLPPSPAREALAGVARELGGRRR